MTEIWKPIKSFEDYYEVSNLGNVRSKTRITNDGKVIKGQSLSISISRYSTVQLYKCNKATNYMVHRLVAQAFVPNPNNLKEVNHIDGNRLNNNADNLEWCTSRQNMLHSVKAGLRQKSYRRPVKCIETQEVFPSLSAAGRFVHTDATRITESIQTHSCCKGYTFLYVDMNVDEEQYMTDAKNKYESFHGKSFMPSAKRVKCVETKETFDSLADAARHFNCNPATIKSHIQANSPLGGYTLEYI